MFQPNLAQCLAKVCNEEHSDWDEKIDTVLMGYHASHQASTNRSPYFILFQQHMRLPIDECLSLKMEEQQKVSLDEVVEALIVSREMFSDAEEHIINAQKKQKEIYDRKHQPATTAMGKRFYLRTLHRSREKVASWSLHDWERTQLTSV